MCKNKTSYIDVNLIRNNKKKESIVITVGTLVPMMEKIFICKYGKTEYFSNEEDGIKCGGKKLKWMLKVTRDIDIYLLKFKLNCEHISGHAFDS